MLETKLQTIIKLENISKTYVMGERTVHALHQVSLQFQTGEMVGIIGVSGSGKSTLMNIMGFLDSSTSGKYFFANQDVSSLLPDELAVIRNQKIGFVFQSFFLLPRLSALQNVMMPLFYRRTSRYLVQKKAEELLAKMGVLHLAHHTPKQLSGGQQQRVAIARALVGDPEVVLADEPTGALDSQTGEDVMQLLMNLNRQEGRTIVIITHDKEISRRCQRVITIKDGKLTE